MNKQRVADFLGGIAAVVFFLTIIVPTFNLAVEMWNAPKVYTVKDAYCPKLDTDKGLSGHFERCLDEKIRVRLLGTARTGTDRYDITYRIEDYFRLTQ